MGRQAARARQPQGQLQEQLAFITDRHLPVRRRMPISRLSFNRSGQMADEVAVLAGGCFWCTEAVFLDVIGVKSVESGYTGGQTANPTYKQVCGGDTGHAEAIRVTFDAGQLSYDELLDIFLGTHDPTQLNRQGNDIGTQYR